MSGQLRDGGVLGTLISAAAVTGIVIGALAGPAAGSLLSMMGVVLVLVRAVLGTTAREHARRTAAVRRVAVAAAATVPVRPPARVAGAPSLRLVVDEPVGVR